LTRVRASGLEEVNWQLHKAMRHAACALIVFFFFYEYNSSQAYKKKSRNFKRERKIHSKTRRNGRTRGGNVARGKSSRGPISHIVGAEVCTSVDITSRPDSSGGNC